MDLQAVRSRLSGLPRQRGKHLCKALRRERDELLQLQQQLVATAAAAAAGGGVTPQEGHMTHTPAIASTKRKVATPLTASGYGRNSKTRTSEEPIECTKRFTRELSRIQRDPNLVDKVKQRLEAKRQARVLQLQQQTALRESTLSWCDTSRGSSDDGGNSTSVDLNSSTTSLFDWDSSNNSSNSLSTDTEEELDIQIIVDAPNQSSTVDQMCHSMTRETPENLLLAALSAWRPLCGDTTVFLTRWGQ